MKQIRIQDGIIFINVNDVPHKITHYERYLLSRLFTEIVNETQYAINVKNDILVYTYCNNIKYTRKENEYNFICSLKGTKFYLDKIKQTLTIYN